MVVEDKFLKKGHPFRQEKKTGGGGIFGFSSGLILNFLSREP